MQGAIYSDQRCYICEKPFDDNFRDGLQCAGHPEQRASRFRVYFRSVSKRFKNYDEAFRFLNGLRYETDRGTFDKRDYRSDLPLSFQNLAEQWLEIKKHEIKKSSYTKINGHIKKAIEFWEHKNIKDFKKRDFQLFINSLGDLSSKTKHNHLSTVHQFFVSLYDNEDLERLPRFPKVPFELAWRNTVDKETQQQIIDEVYTISKDINVKIWLGIKFLSIYFNVRPKELINIKEKHIDLQQGEILIPDPKEKKPKHIFLLDEDVDLLGSFPRGFPELYFFRHNKGKGGVRPGDKFGDKYLYKFWKRACKNLGIEGVDLYGGTRHSSVRSLRHIVSPEEIKLASGHSTSRAFERYYKLEPDDLRKTYSIVAKQRGGKELAKGFKLASD